MKFQHIYIILVADVNDAIDNDVYVVGIDKGKIPEANDKSPPVAPIIL